MLPERSVSAKAAKTVFFDHLNEIDVFIEDTKDGSKKLYTKLLSKVFKNKYIINNIFPLGGRLSVIGEFEKNKLTIKKPTIYIVDGDLYLLRGDSPENDKGLYLTPFYCIENILLDSNALIKIVEEEDVNMTESEADDALDFNGWLINNKLLLSLFVEYAVSMLLVPSIQTVGYPVINLISSGDGLIDIKKTNKRIENIKKDILSIVSNDSYEAVKDRIKKSINMNEADLIKYVSGKDYLYPLMEKRIRQITKSHANSITLKQRIANLCDVQVIKDMREYVLEPQ